MKIIFEIKYRANQGDELWIDGDISLPLTAVDEELWRGEYFLCNQSAEKHDAESILYRYELRRDGGVTRVEAECAGHTVEFVEGIDVCHKRDSWIDKLESRPLNSSLFTKAVFRRESPSVVSVEAATTIVETRCGVVSPSQVLALVGVSKELGHWCASAAAVMADGEFPVWRVSLPQIKVHTDCKFAILDRKTREVVAWERGDNRILEPYNFEGLSDGEATLSVVCEPSPLFDVEPWRGTGVSIPIFSLRTERSMGVGDFGDIRNMVDWAVAREMSVIQILPINDTTMGGTWEDSYPYNANSTFALHPQYLALREVGIIEDEALRESFESRAAKIDALPKIDYMAVSELKMSYLRVVFAQQMASLKRKKTYRDFFKKNSWWLEPYALFSVLRDRSHTPNFLEWGDDATYSEALLARYKKSDAKQEMEFYYFVQYHLHIQLLAATEYARQHGVALKGDIPIGISRTSVDAWIYPDLFNLSSQAGAPPDPFSDLGQNWGFPTYNWERMAEDDYAWWRARFEKMAEYFDAYRIDHILGFFRIWEIPMGSIHGLTGYFNPALPLSVAEIEASSFPFSLRHTRPYVTDWSLRELLPNEDIEEIKSTYFTKSEAGEYRFREEFDTQRKIAAQVDEGELRDGLMMLHNEVLFVEDPQKQGYYHPRILAATSLVYSTLQHYEKLSFDNLHDDFYYRRHNDFWRDSAMKKLPQLTTATNMLVCGEDLGMIPECVADVMSQLQLLTLEIERMPKGFGVTYANPAEYPYLSVCTCSTHDMNTIRGWWLEDAKVTQLYYNNALGLSGVAPKECSGDIARRILERHVNSPAMLTILPWQDWMAENEELRNPDVEGERINVPANSRHYWRYRMHCMI